MALLAERFLPDTDADPALAARRRAGAEEAARDWLETQARVAAFWRDMVADANGDLALVRALDAHREFLLGAAEAGSDTRQPGAAPPDQFLSSRARPDWS